MFTDVLLQNIGNVAGQFAISADVAGVYEVQYDVTTVVGGVGTTTDTFGIVRDGVTQTTSATTVPAGGSGNITGSALVIMDVGTVVEVRNLGGLAADILDAQIVIHRVAALP